MALDTKIICKAIGKTAVQRIKQRIKQNRITPKTNKSGGTTLVKSSKLVNSIKHKVNADNTIVIGSNLKYARIHHEGGIIRPVNKQFLTIPLAPIAKVKSARDFEDTFIAKGIIFQNREGQKPLPLFKLQKKVEIPSRKYMYLDENDLNHLRKQIARFVNKGVENGI